MARSWLSSRSRSEGVGLRWAGAFTAAAVIVCAALPAPAMATGVTGSVRIEMATIRMDGPKPDRDVVVMLERIGGPAPPAASGKVRVDQRGMVFIPHVLAIQKGTTVTFLNNDREQHNVYFLDEKTGKTLDIGTYGPGVSVDHTFTQPGTVIALCKLHLEMAAYIVVSDGPWFTTAQLDPTGQVAFSIPNVPPGEYKVSVWHKKLKPIGLAERLVVPQSGSVELPIVLTTASRAKKGR